MVGPVSFVQIARSSFKSIKALSKNFVDILFPQKCSVCDNIIGSNAFLCYNCFNKITFIGKPCCAKCSEPFEYELEDGALCAICIAITPKYEKATSVFIYNTKSSDIIHKFKYNDRIYGAKFLAKWMTNKGEELINKSDLIIPVPLHKLRLYKRLYNQSSILARYIGQNTNKQVLYNCLVRVKNTKPQFGLSYRKRRENIKGAFAINHRFISIIKGKVILLIDDVMTTGATIDICTNILFQNGAKSVYVLTLAKTSNTKSDF